MSTLRISNIEAKADSSSPTVDEQLRFTNSDGDLMLYLDGRTAGITTVGINTTNQTIKFDANNNVMVTGIITATEFHGSLAVGTSVTYGDNEKAYFGNGLDLELFHNGTNSVINNTEGALLFQNNGSSSMYIGSTGKVGIGTNNPTASLVVRSSDNTLGILTSTDDGANLDLFDNDTQSRIRTVDGQLQFRADVGNDVADSSIRFFIDGTNEKLRIDSSGKLGVGDFSSTSVAQQLHVRGSQPEIYLEHTGGYDLTFTTNDGAGQCGINPSGGYLSLAANNKNIVMCRTGGSVGISSATPDAPLTLYTAASQAWKFRINTSVSDGAGFYQRSNGDFEMVLRDASNNNNYIAGTGGALQFTTSGSERLRILSDGRMGINTTTVFDTNTMLQVTGKTGAGPNLVLHRNDTSVSQNQVLGALRVTGNDSDGTQQESSAIEFVADADHGTGDKPGRLVFKTTNDGASSSTEKVRITSDGNMGLGLTPAYSGLFGGAQRTFHIGGTAAPCLRITSSSSGQADLVVHAGNSGRRADIANMATNGTISIWTKPSSGSIAERMRIGSTGIIDAPTQAGFYARLNTNLNDKTGDGTYYTVEWDTDSGSICYDQHNTFSTSTGLYTIPTNGDGVYQFATAVCLSTDVYGRQGEAWFVVGGLRIFFDRRYFPSATGTITGFYGSCIAKMTAGQTIGVQVFVNGGAKNVDVFGAGANDHISWFSGRKIA
jgi:hypothetical protein